MHSTNVSSHRDPKLASSSVFGSRTRLRSKEKSLCAGLLALLLSFGAMGASSRPYSATQVPGPVTVATAVLHGMVTPNGLPTTAWFEWSGESGEVRSSPAMEAGSGFVVEQISATVEGLALGEVYHCQLVCSNALGLTRGVDVPFVAGGRVNSWGDTGVGSNLGAVWLDGVTGISLGKYHSLAVWNSGRAVACGLSSFGLSEVPKSASNVVAVAAGEQHNLVLRDDGVVVAWGNNNYGQTNVPAKATNVVAIAAGASHNLALKVNGTVITWGLASYGLGQPPAGLSNVVAIAAGQQHSLALKANGTVQAWGSGSYGQTAPPIGLSNVVAIAAGANHCLALKSDGTVVAWGQNIHGQTRVPVGLSGVVSIAAGNAHSMALCSDGIVVAWGSNTKGQCAVPANLTNVVGIAGGYTDSLALRGVADSDYASPFAATQSPGPVASSYATLHGMATPNGVPTAAWIEWGTTAAYGKATPVVDVGTNWEVVQVEGGIENLESGAVYHCRLVASNQFGVTYGSDTVFTTGQKVAAWGDGNGGLRPVPVNYADVVSVACGHGHSLALTSSGRVRSWGTVYGDFHQTNVPSNLEGVVGIAAGFMHSLALRQDGTAVAWGFYPYSGRSAFVPSDLSGAIALAGGDDFSVALLKDGTVRAWGADSGGYGTLRVPGGLNNVVKIASGASHALALRSDGSVVAWGDGSMGQTRVPQNATNVVEIGTSVWHNLAVRADGTVVTWGYNTPGLLDVPGDLSNVVSVAAGLYHSAALRADGTVVVWGENNYRQLEAPEGLTNVVGLASGDNHLLVLAPNLAPQPFSLSYGVVPGSETVLNPPVYDPNGDPLSYRVLSLPSKGALLQYSEGVGGTPISAVGTPIADPLGRVVYAAPPDGVGYAYDAFEVSAKDGWLEGLPGRVTLHLLPMPRVLAEGLDPGAAGAFKLSWNGVPDAPYSVWGSTDLLQWSWIGAAKETPDGLFSFADSDATNRTFRFYRVRSP